jgi:integrase
MPALIAAVNAEPSPYVRAFFWLRLMLGTRRTELLRARWEDVNLEQRTLYLPETKANRPHTLALAPEAVAILKTLPRMDGNPYVFPSPKKKRKGEPEEPMADVKRQWKRIRRTVTVDLWTAANPDRAAALRKQDDDDDTAYRAAVLQEVGGKLWDVRGHDLRRTVGSWAASSGESLVTIGSVLNHSDPSTTAIYARLTQNVQRTALENHATQLLAVAGVKPTI